MTGVVSALAIFGFANQFITRVLERGVLTEAVDRIGDYAWWVDSIVGVVAVLVVVTVLAVIGYVLQFWGFRLTRHSGGTLHITRGLLTSRESSIEEKRIRGLEVGEPLGLRLVGGGRLHVITTGLSKREDRRGYGLAGSAGAPRGRRRGGGCGRRRPPRRSPPGSRTTARAPAGAATSGPCGRRWPSSSWRCC